MSLTAEPWSTCWEEAGSVCMTTPSGTVGDDWRTTSPTLSPAASRAAVAVPSSMFMTFGTWTSGGPEETNTSISGLAATFSPGSGLVRSTMPSATVVLASSRSRGTRSASSRAAAALA